MNSFTRFLCTSALVLSLSQTSHCRDSEPQGVFQLRLNKFTTDITDPKCCDNAVTNNGLRRTNNNGCDCDIKFRVCFRNYMQNIGGNSEEECTFGKAETAVVSGRSGDLSARLQPITFDINFKWPGDFSLIIEAIHTRRNERNETMVHRVIKSRTLDAGEGWSYGGDDRLDYDYRLICSENYYGRDCYKHCKDRDDNFGHYKCDNNGRKVCLPGWTGGDYCTTPVCSPGCSKQNGFCKQPGECMCREGWQGANCDECMRYPGCVHGTCSAPFKCECKTGWGGLLCNKDLNFCTNHRPCQNGASCYNTGDDYTCSCPIGFSGRNCEVRVENKCLESPCLNDGECLPGAKDDYQCRCKAGYAGHHCEVVVATLAAQDSCNVNPCENSGTCIESLAGYTCTCPPGFEGKNCEINTNDCIDDPCQHGGTCFDFINSYKCICPNGYIGTHCEENYDDCKNEPCANGGVCTDGVNDFTCACTPGFTGKDCSLEINECDSDPCLNGGFCIDGNNTFTCRCLPRHSGKYCEILPDGSIDPKYYELHIEPTSNDDSANHALIGTFSALVPIIALVAALVIYCMKQNRKREQQRADFEAQLENELNAVNSMNKTKMLDDHMIVNSLDFPKQKSINTNPNITDEMKFQAKEDSYNQMSRAKSTKQLNTDNLYNTAVTAGHRAAGAAVTYCDSSSVQYVRSSPAKNMNAERSRLITTKNTNLDLSSSTLCSSSSEKSGYKKDLNQQYLSGGVSCGTPSPAPSSAYNDDNYCNSQQTKCSVDDDLLATEV